MKYYFMRFPEGKFKAMTLSYDDGVTADIRFSEVLNKYGIKCTFNINSAAMERGEAGRLNAEQIRRYMLDAGHEVAVHGENHAAPGIALPSVAIADVLNCRLTLEHTFGRIIRGMAYPDTGVLKLHNGNEYSAIKSYLQSLGIVYARTLGGDNNSFMLPSDFHAWTPTVHHSNPKLLEWTDLFLSIREEELYITSRYPRLFYMWGHSYEFDRAQNWGLLDEFCEKASRKEDIWYATNIEIYEYIKAYESLVMSADGNRIYNPTHHQIWLQIDQTNYTVQPNETLVLP